MKIVLKKRFTGPTSLVERTHRILLYSRSLFHDRAVIGRGTDAARAAPASSRPAPAKSPASLLCNLPRSHRFHLFLRGATWPIPRPLTVTLPNLFYLIHLSVNPYHSNYILPS